jgi:hypothetical protein
VGSRLCTLAAVLQLVGHPIAFELGAGCEYFGEDKMKSCTG